VSERATAQSVLRRVLDQVEYVDNCWIFTGYLDPSGYGRTSFGAGRGVFVHRFTYETLVGPIPDGLVLDHVVKRGCLSVACCNPSHLEPVSTRENTVRGRATYANRALCRAGLHDITDPANIYTRRSGRTCRPCLVVANARSRERGKAAHA